jgi:hypothetical protein
MNLKQAKEYVSRHHTVVAFFSRGPYTFVRIEVRLLKRGEDIRIYGCGFAKYNPNDTDTVPFSLLRGREIAEGRAISDAAEVIVNYCAAGFIETTDIGLPEDATDCKEERASFIERVAADGSEPEMSILVAFYGEPAVAGCGDVSYSEALAEWVESITRRVRALEGAGLQLPQRRG